MKSIVFLFDYVHLLYYKCHKINPNRGGSYIDSPDWIKNKKEKCFQYIGTVTLNYEEMKKDPQRITRIKPLINKHNWEGINFPSEKDNWKIFEKNNATIDLSVLYAKKRKNTSCTCFKTTQIVKNKLFYK